MFEFEKKRRVRRIIYSKFSIFILFLILIFLLQGVWGLYQKVEETNQKKEMVSNKIAGLEEREDYLNSEIDYLNSGVGLEEEIRNRYSVSKEGEEVIVIIEEDPIEEPVQEKEPSFLGNIWNSVTSFTSLFK